MASDSASAEVARREHQGVTRGEDVDDDDLVGIGEGSEYHEGAVREYMWGSKTALPIADLLAHGSQRGAHLRRLVRVVVIDDHAGSIRDRLHPSPGSGEGAQALRQPIERRSQLARHGQRRGSVQDVVLPGQR
jgi:hypothetical protein